MGRDQGRRVFISAGEPSGDIVSARLAAEILRRDPAARLFGVGGPRMAAAGVDLVSHTTDIGVVGVTETLGTLPSVVRAYRDIHRRVRRERPDAAVLVGNDVFNVVLARRLRAAGIPAIAYFPPQVWVWRSLARPIARSFDAILASFPDEYAVYAGAASGTRVTWVGHYLADDLHATTAEERVASRRELGVPIGGRVVGLLPGSRRLEVRALSSVFFDAAERLLAEHEDLWFVVPVAHGVDAEPLRQAIEVRSIAPRTRVTRESHPAMRAADLLLVASGTASLEAALVGTPMVIAYRVSTVSNLVVRAAIALGLIDAYVAGLPNLVLDRGVVPEVLQRRVTAEALAREATALLSTPSTMDAMRRQLAEVGARLRGRHALAEAADAILEWADEGAHRAADAVPTGWRRAPVQRRLDAAEPK